MRGTARDATLWRKMGQAYVKTHQYNQAVRHYESAVKLGGHDSLVVDLVELLLKLRQYGKAQRTLMTALHCDDGTLTVSSLMSNVQYFLLLARAHYADQGSVQDTLEKAHSVQESVLKRCQTERPELLEQGRTVLCSICCQLARHYRSRTDVDRTKYYYNQAIVAIGRTDNKISLELAQFYLENGKTDEAMMQVEEVLGRDALLPDATMVYGDIKLKEEKFDESVEIYLGLMDRCPDNFVFLAKCIQVLRRSARLDDALALFQACEHHNHGATTEPGYNYCKGLYYWHVYRVSEALFHLNKARRDNEWGDQALELMIRICLNPDNEVMGGEVFETPQEEWSMSQLGGAEHREQVGVATAQNLVKEFRPRQGSSGGQRSDGITLLVNLCLMATRDPKHIQRALQVFTELASTKVNNVPYLLAMGQAFMLLKQTPRARNQLKRLTKVEWSWELSESLETAWLLLADVYIKSGKYDIACDLLQRCIKYNQSCSRAYEYMGYIREKEQSYHDASVFYGHAWLYTNRVNPSMGFRLAFNYLKFKQYNEAIEVLTEHPDYPLIQTEVLERARSALRP
ncbi:tetratricopeptide repeat protein 21B-like [Salvelinus alpinus]